MNFTRKYIGVVIGFLIGVILASSITVYAYNYFANDIGYTRSGTEITNVSQALNDLYTKANSNLNYEVIQYHDDIQTDYTYTIKNDDLQYKSIVVIAGAGNVSREYAAANIYVTNSNIVPIYNPDELYWTDYGYHVTNDMYVGVINNPVKDDNIKIKGFYGFRVLILGIK